MRTSRQSNSSGGSMSQSGHSSYSSNSKLIPHQGSLCRVDDGDRAYVIEILVRLHKNTTSATATATATRNNDDETLPAAASAINAGGVSYRHELAYTRRDFQFAQRLFLILDTESHGLVDRETVKEFVVLRCPVFWRRDDDLKRLTTADEYSCSASPTFDEIWQAVAMCSSNNSVRHDIASVNELGVEGWMVFCRFIALAQYLEAKRRFSARHLQQTMRQRNAPRGSEVIMVDVPPLEPPAELSPLQLANYEKRSKAPLPLPELDLDHSLVAAHDAIRARPLGARQGLVKIRLFGSSTFSTGILQNSAAASSSSNLEFAVSYTRHSSVLDAVSSSQFEEVVARRSMQDMKWLNATFDSHKVLGGTLCGRILPLFHPEGSSSASCVLSHFHQDLLEDSRFSVKSTSGAISAAATAGVGKLRDAAKSFRTYLNAGSSGGDDSSETAPSLANTMAKKPVSKKPGVVRSLPESYYNPNSPAGRARHLERYLNYLLEHPALSTSFPLNTILKGSQSGLEAAKEMLAICDKARDDISTQTPHMDDGKAGASAAVPNFAWVRTAAQAAMALHVHGMLETTGMPSASARLQHASLPTLAAGRNWEGDDDEHRSLGIWPTVEERTGEERVNFEAGVVSVQSELQSVPSDPFCVVTDDDYDLLPLPVPAPERRILSEGSNAGTANIPREARFHYGSSSPNASFQLERDDMEYRSGMLSDMAVDENIDKLREVIGSVDNTLSRCLASCGAIGKAHKDRQSLHLEVVRSLDSFAGMRGKFVSQRSLMKGLAGVEQSGTLYEEAFISMIDDLSWQTSLSRSAVAAAEDVRSSVRASRVAANAKAAASSAALTAQSACDSGNFASIDEARAAQTRSSIAQSHAIHAAVVEHEAKTVKRRATLALANDVKVWNIHRKREMLLSSIAYARSQHEATRRAVDAWSSLRDGFVGSSMIPASSADRRNIASTSRRSYGMTFPEHCEVTATIYEAEATIVATDHPILTSFQVPESTICTSAEQVDKIVSESSDLFSGSESLILPFASASPIIDDLDTMTRSSLNGSSSLIGSSSHYQSKSNLVESEPNNDEVMTASMQSLVDGLMTWGGGFDADEDHFVLPRGMAASIVLEGNLMG